MIARTVLAEEEESDPPLPVVNDELSEAVKGKPKKAEVIQLGKPLPDNGLSEVDREIKQYMDALSLRTAYVDLQDYVRGEPPDLLEDAATAVGSSPRELDDSFFLQQWLWNRTPRGYTSQIKTRPEHARTQALWGLCIRIHDDAGGIDILPAPGSDAAVEQAVETNGGDPELGAKM